VILAVAVGLTAIGWIPTRRLGGSTGTLAMMTAIGCNVAVSVASALPITFAKIRPRKDQLVAVSMGSIALRMLLVTILAVAVVLSGLVATTPFLLWIAIAYALFLPIDTLHAVRHAKSL
jgi:hypothetical protein